MTELGTLDEIYNGTDNFYIPMDTFTSDITPSNDEIIGIGDFYPDLTSDLRVVSFVGDTDTFVVSPYASFALSAQHGTLQMDNVSISVDEGAGSATFSISRTGGSEGVVSVDYVVEVETDHVVVEHQPHAGELRVDADGVRHVLEA